MMRTETSILEAQTEKCRKQECVKIACLPYEPAPVGDACWIAGWGRANEKIGDGRNRLFEGGVNIMSNDYCIKRSKPSYNKYKKLQPDEFCAGTPGTAHKILRENTCGN